MNIHSANISSAKPIPVARHLKSNVEEIKFATSKSELGTVLVARSAAGVCAILIGNRADVLKRELAGEFTDAKLVHDDRALRTDLDKTLTFIKTPAKGLDLRLDIRGTAFASGTPCSVFGSATRLLTQRSPPALANRARSVPSRMPARPTQLRWLSRVIVWSGVMAPLQATAGAQNARRSLSRKKRRRSHEHAAEAGSGIWTDSQIIRLNDH
jgi:hypothetical protein